MDKRVYWFIFLSFCNFNAAYSYFGQEGVPMEDYYKAGQYATGVAKVRFVKKMGFSSVTAHLIDVGIESLKGRLMITCSHGIVETKNEPQSVSVSFADEHNNRRSVKVLDIFTHDKFEDEKHGHENSQNDIAIILLGEKVDTEKYKPLKLNLSIENSMLVGKKVYAYGFSPVNGRVDSNIAIDEGFSSLRRGMETIINHGSNASPNLLNALFYPYQGFIKIERHEKKGGLTHENELKKQKFEKEMKDLEPAYKDALTHNDKNAIENIKSKIFELQMEMLSLPSIVIRRSLSQIILNDEELVNKIKSLDDTGDLDNQRLLQEWNNHLTSNTGAVKEIVLGDYHISFHKPLPKLSAIPYEGDSGGAWIVDGQIVGVTHGSYHSNQNIVKEIHTTPSSPLNNYVEYFENCEKLVTNQKSSRFLEKDNVKPTFIASTWGNRDWVQLTLKELSLSLQGAIELDYRGKSIRLSEQEAKNKGEEIDKELEKIMHQHKEATKHGNEVALKEIKDKGWSLHLAKLNLPIVVTQTPWPRPQTIRANEGFMERINTLDGTADLDKHELLNKWEEFRKSEKSKETINIGDYSVSFLNYYRG